MAKYVGIYIFTLINKEKFKMFPKNSIHVFQSMSMKKTCQR